MEKFYPDVLDCQSKSQLYEWLEAEVLGLYNFKGDLERRIMAASQV